ncbi:zinc finger domain-containing protein [Streptomyces sp. H27-D2]|uniref:zinc finger domain-containing protein n=1 Tax=Streptomyces sp. H27-D2 TaxID=3046304 RepID=UPI002DC01A82|nr:hypothetical protein [Streptomyces sp. H27-D2]MEC4016032.1 hypothetical protein [Streptomyces sp. H27-D2]
MKTSEASNLLTRCAGFDNRQPSHAAAEAWASALSDIPLDADAFAAVDRFYGTPPKDPSQRLWIQPHDVRRTRRTIRSERLENFQYEPVGNESPAEFLARYRGQLDAIASASGRTGPPAGRLALTGGPHRDVAKELAGVGRTVPDSDEEALVDTVRRAGPLGVQCPACGAVMGRSCKTPGGTSKHVLGKPRSTPHTARVRAASGQAEVTPEQRAAEEERRREASRLVLARMESEGEIPDADIVEGGASS